MNGLAFDHHSTADARSHGHVDTILNILRGAPLCFGKRRGIDIGLKCDRDGQFLRKRRNQVTVAPGGFGGRGDIAIGGGRRIEINRAKTGEPERG